MSSRGGCCVKGASLVLSPSLPSSSLHLASRVTEQGSPQIPAPARHSCLASFPLWATSASFPSCVSQGRARTFGLPSQPGVPRCLPLGSFWSCLAAGLSLSCSGVMNALITRFPSLVCVSEPCHFGTSVNPVTVQANLSF